MESLSNSPLLLASSHEHFLMGKILQTHAPDDRRINSAPLLSLADEIFRSITTPAASRLSVEPIRAEGTQDIGLVSTIHRISCEIQLCSIRDRRSLHATTMAVLELLGIHSWGTKVVIVLAALAKSYGEFWLVLQLCRTNSLALLMARLKGLKDSSGTMESFRHRFKALRYLFERMVDVAKSIAEFEILPVQYETLDCGAMAAVKAHIHMASYWVIRSSVACASQITGMIGMNSELLYNSLTPATWELWSSAHKISRMSHHLRKKLDNFHAQIENNIHSSLLQLFGEVHVDNHKVLSTLFASKDEGPLRDRFSQKKVGPAVLRNKVVMLFISRPVIQLEKFLLIMQQLQKDPHGEAEKLYEVVWVPIATSFPWSRDEERAFSLLIEILPWYSLWEPSILSLSVKKFIQEVWHYEDDPQMVVLDARGKVTSLNAIDVVSIWGSMAYPFSVARERELWEQQSWTLEFLLDGIDSLISFWMAEGRTICLYGSNNFDWVRDLTNKMKNIIKAGVLLELIYVGSNCIDHSKEILATIIKEKLSSYLPATKINIFWLRLESIRRLNLQFGHKIDSGFIKGDVNSLFNLDSDNKGWLLVSKGSSTEILELVGTQALECLSFFYVWGAKIYKLGFLGSLRRYLDPHSVTNHCDYCSISPYVEGMDEGIVVCKNCNCPMEKYFMYQCITTS